MVNKTVVKVFFLVLIVFSICAAEIRADQEQKEQRKGPTVIVVGLPKGQTSIMQKALEEAGEYKSYLDKGDELVKESKIDEAIVAYKTAYSIARISGARGVALLAMSDAYEKKRDYEKALELVIMDRDKYVNAWAKKPVIERAKYLEYALQGEYELAVEHAQKALEEDTKLPNATVGGSPDYIQRLNDLKAAKDHILSLKKNDH